MDRRCVFLKCDQCGAQFSVTFGGGVTRGLMSHECPVCHAQVSSANLTDMGAAPFRGNFRAELEVLLCAARTHGMTSVEIMQALQEELQFEAELSGRAVAVKLVELGPGTMGAARLASRERMDAKSSRHSTA